MNRCDGVKEKEVRGLISQLRPRHPCITHATSSYFPMTKKKRKREERNGGGREDSREIPE